MCQRHYVAAAVSDVVLGMCYSWTNHRGAACFGAYRGEAPCVAEQLSGRMTKGDQAFSSENANHRVMFVLVLSDTLEEKY
jgi:hypothetical protein